MECEERPNEPADAQEASQEQPVEAEEAVAQEEAQEAVPQEEAQEAAVQERPAEAQEAPRQELLAGAQEAGEQEQPADVQGAAQQEGRPQAAAAEEVHPQAATAEEDRPQAAVAEEEDCPQAEAAEEDHPQAVAAEEEDRPQAAAAEEDRPQGAAVAAEEGRVQAEAAEEGCPQAAAAEQEVHPQAATAEEDRPQGAAVAEEEDRPQAEAAEGDRPQSGDMEEDHPQAVAAAADEGRPQAAAAEEGRPQAASAEEADHPQAASAEEDRRQAAAAAAAEEDRLQAAAAEAGRLEAAAAQEVREQAAAAARAGQGAAQNGQSAARLSRPPARKASRAYARADPTRRVEVAAAVADHAKRKAEHPKTPAQQESVEATWARLLKEEQRLRRRRALREAEDKRRTELQRKRLHQEESRRREIEQRRLQQAEPTLLASAPVNGFHEDQSARSPTTSIDEERDAQAPLRAVPLGPWSLPPLPVSFRGAQLGVFPAVEAAVAATAAAAMDGYGQELPAGVGAAEPADGVSANGALGAVASDVVDPPEQESPERRHRGTLLSRPGRGHYPHTPGWGKKTPHERKRLVSSALRCRGPSSPPQAAGEVPAARRRPDGTANGGKGPQARSPPREVPTREAPSSAEKRPLPVHGGAEEGGLVDLTDSTEQAAGDVPLERGWGTLSPSKRRAYFKSLMAEGPAAWAAAQWSTPSLVTEPVEAPVDGDVEAEADEVVNLMEEARVEEAKDADADMDELMHEVVDLEEEAEAAPGTPDHMLMPFRHD